MTERRRMSLGDFEVVREPERTAYITHDNLHAVLGKEYDDLIQYCLSGQCDPKGLYAHDVERWLKRRNQEKQFTP